MRTKDFDLADKGSEVVKAMELLDDRTEDLAALNDEPQVKQEEVEGLLAAIIRVIVAALKH